MKTIEPSTINTPGFNLDDAPFGLDSYDPAPLLVWRNGGKSYRALKPDRLRGFSLCYQSKEDAIKARARIAHTMAEPWEDEPYRVVLDEYVALCRMDGSRVALVDGDLRIIEVYR